MATDRDLTLELIARSGLPEESTGRPARDLLPAAIDLLAELGKDGDRKIYSSLLDMVLRGIEVSILGDEVLINVAQYWDAYAGQREERVAARLTELLGGASSPQLFGYVMKCLGSSPARQAGKAAPSASIVYDVFSQQYQASVSKQLRCTCCGFHFRRSDLGSDRLAIADELGFSLADYLHARRIADPLKPIVYPNSTKSPTDLQLDHITPELSFGWGARDNLRILCQFCNAGKLAYRRPLEPLSPSIAGSLMERSDPGHSIFRQLMVVSAIGAAGGRCERSGRTIDGSELTCVRDATLNYAQISLLPWNVKAVAYEALGDS